MGAFDDIPDASAADGDFSAAGAFDDLPDSGKAKAIGPKGASRKPITLGDRAAGQEWAWGKVKQGARALGEAVGLVEPPSVLDDPAAHKGAERPVSTAPSLAPVDEKMRQQFNAAWDSATPEQRAALSKRNGWVGQLARERAGLYDNPAATITETGSKFDTRAESRAQRLAGQGEDPRFARAAARAGALGGVAPGREVAALGGTAQESKFDFETAQDFDPNAEANGMNRTLGRGLAKGGLGVTKAVAGYGQALAELYGLDAATQQTRELGEWARGKEDAIGNRGDFLQRNMEGAISSIAQQLPLLALGAANASQVIPLAGMAVQTFGQEYSDGRDAKLAPREAAARASLMSAFEVIGEKFGLGQQLELMRRSARGVETGQLANFFGEWIGNTLKREIPGELLTTTGQFGVDKVQGIGLQPNATWADYTQQVADTIAQTVLQGGIMAGGTTGVGAASAHLGGSGERTPEQAEAEAMAARDRALRAWETARAKGFVVEAPLPTDKPSVRRAKTVDMFRELGAMFGIPQAAQDLAIQHAEKQPVHSLPGFFARYAQALQKRGLVGAELDPDVLEAMQSAGVALAQPQPIAAEQSAQQTAPEMFQQPPMPGQSAQNLEQSAPPAQQAGAVAAVPQGSLADQLAATGLAEDVDSAMDQPEAPAKAPEVQPADAVDISTTVDAAAHQAATSPTNDLPEPSQAMKEAGNYKVGRTRIAGLDIRIENPQGSKRRGTAPDGTPWETEMRAHYGYVAGTEGADGDKLDVFIKAGTPEDWRGPVFVIDQVDPATGDLDEHKVVMGVADEAEAEALYRSNYDADWQGFGAITRLPLPVFKAWAKSGRLKEPLGDIAARPQLAPDRKPADASSAASNDGQHNDESKQPEAQSAPAAPEATQATADQRGAGQAGAGEQGRRVPGAGSSPATQAAGVAKVPVAARSQAGLDPERDTMLQALAKLGGIRRDVVASEFGLKPEELKHTVSTGKLKAYPFRKTGGMDLDQAMTSLAEAGYFDGVAPEDVRAVFEEAIYGELGGTPRYTALGEMRRAEDAYNAQADEAGIELSAEELAERDAIMAEAGLTSEQLGTHPDEAIEIEARPQSIADGMRAMGFTEQEIADELAQAGNPTLQGREGSRAEDPEVASRQAQAPPGSGDEAPGPAGGDRRDARAAGSDARDGQAREDLNTVDDRPRSDVARESSPQYSARQQESLFSGDEAPATGRLGYETDLFGNPLPADAGRLAPARSAEAGVQGDAQPAGELQDTPAPAGRYRVRTIVGTETRRKLGVGVIKTPQQAALATAYLYRSPVERFDAIVTDDDGKPLGVVGGFKGAVSQTAVYPATVLAEAVRIPGASRIWFSHNHPSGAATLSQADEMLNKTLASAFEGSGITAMGMIAVAGNRYGFIDGDGATTDEGRIPDPVGSFTVPVIERELINETEEGELHPLSSPRVARQYAQQLYAQADQPGVMLLDAQHRVAAWVPLAPEMMGRLKGTGGLAAIYRAISESNASGAILVHGGELSARRGDGTVWTIAQNIGAAAGVMDVRVLDIVDVNSDVTAAEAGEHLVAGSVFSIAGEPALFVSDLMGQVQRSPMNAGTAGAWQQYLDALAKRGAIKADEVEWTGLREWLAMQAGKVSKSDISAFLDANGVQVQEVTLAPEESGMDMDDWLYEWAEDREGPTAEAIQDGDTWDNIRAAAREEGQAEVLRRLDAKIMPSKFERWTVPGGQNYREVLLTLPAKDTITERKVKAPAGWGGTEGGDVGVERSGDTGADFRSGHWDQPNVLAHIRVDERTDADGKRVLFVQEIQSDWGQQGKKKGFKTGADGRRKLKELGAEWESLARVAQGPALTEEAMKAREQARLRQAEIADTMNAISDAERDGLPRAPFVTKTDAWVGLAIKRVIKMAADEGFDRVAFINGQQAADLFDLSKQIDSLIYGKEADGTYSILATKDGREAVKRDNVKVDALEDLVGKEMAAKIVAGDGKDIGAGEREFSGLDLKVGGEGMRTFYDQIVPKVAKDVLRKVGGASLNQIDLRAGKSGRPRYQVEQDTQGKWIAYNPSDQYDFKEFDTEAKAREFADPKIDMANQVGFDITPAIREKAAQGLPLFSRRAAEGVGAGVGGGSGAAGIVGIGAQPSVVPVPDRATISRVELDEIINRNLDSWRGLGLGRVMAVERWDELPQQVLADARKSGVHPGLIEGVVHRGRVYLVRANLRDGDHAERVLFHEAYGHIGVRAALQGSPAAELAALWSKLNGLAGVAKLAKKHQVGDGMTAWDRLQPYIQAASTDVESRRAQIMDELVAFLAQANDTGALTQFKTYLADLKAAVVALAKRLGLNGLADRLDRAGAELDVLQLVRDARRAVRLGTGRDGSMVVLGAAPAPAFSGGDAHSVRADRPVTLTDVIVGSPLAAATGHPDYSAAKSGDVDAAVRLALDLVTPDLVAKVRATVGSDVIVQPVTAEEASGRNKIPLAGAKVLANELGASVGLDVVQASRAHRTNMDGLGRLFASPEFIGEVVPGGRYLLVDDTVTQGGTFAALASHIEQNGGTVVGALALTGKQYSAKLRLSPDLLSEVRETYSDVEPAFRAATGRGFDSLTESEARYLAKHKSPDAVRGRILEAGRQAGSLPDGRDSQGPQSLSEPSADSGDSASAFSLSPQDPDPLKRAMAKAGLRKTSGVAGRAKEMLASAASNALAMVQDRNQLAARARQNVLDQFAGIDQAVRREIGNLPVEQDPYIAARLANGGTSSVMRALLMHGKARWASNGQHLEKIDGSKGLLDILAPLGDDLNDWFAWMIGNRAARLAKEGRENLFSSEEISAMQQLDRGRKELFTKTAMQYADFKKSVLDVAQGAGLLDAEARKAWDHADYIPFYRQIDERAAFSPTGRKGLAGQTSGIRTLKGGTGALNDPMENLLMNFSRLIDASLKNNALLKTIDTLGDKSGVVTKVGYEMAGELIPKDQIRKLLVQEGASEHAMSVLPDAAFDGMAKMWAIKPPSDPDVIRVMRNGKPEFYRVNDDLLLKAVTSFVPFDFPGLGLARWFKRTLTHAVTSTPEFMLRNYIRDTLSSAMISRDDFSLADSLKGIAESYTGSGASEAMLFAGASFQSGVVNAADPTATAVAMRRALRKRGLDASSVASVAGSVLDTGLAAWERYREAGEAIENANREAIYKAAIEAGRTATAAAYEAKDLMDFSLRGSHPIYQVMADVLPFFNARVQGLYRMGRADPARVAKYGAVLMAASLALAALNAGEDWYEELPDWDRDTFWHIRVGGHHFRIPKPFELGVIFATLPERMMRFMSGHDAGGKTADRMWSNVRDQLAFDLVPQIFRPALDVYSNHNAFRDAPIEGLGDERKLPHLRASAQTSDTMKALTAAAPDVADALGASPKRLEHLIGGYFGTAGLYALGVADIAVRALDADAAPRPQRRLDDIPVVKAFYREDPARSTVFESDFYKVRQKVEQVYASVNQLRKDGEERRAQQLADDKQELLAARGVVQDAARQLSKMNKERDAIYKSMTLTPEEKRRRLDDLQIRRNALTKRVMRSPEVKAAAS